MNIDPDNELLTMPIEELAEIFGEAKRDTELLNKILRYRIMQASEKLPISKISELTGLSRQTIYNWITPRFDAQKNPPQA